MPEQIIDISRPTGPVTAHWPGDTPFELTFPVSRGKGDFITVGTVRMSTHFGTHLDAPMHFADSPITIDRVPLPILCGTALVVEASGGTEIVLPNQLDLPQRVLFRTGAWPNHGRFPRQIPTLALATVEKLALASVQLVGIDLPSVDQLESKDLPIHHALLQAGIYILESLWLEAVWPGTYQLVALPIKLVGADAAPVRAVLFAQETGND
ncbi:MAG TPA: cyclase family protein [Chthoniobacterales bacterium]|jgi:arylformamidase|nr:cyclase family protein [Chthoniobacterales bacterium]